jgi:hypothetical protein
MVYDAAKRGDVEYLKNCSMSELRRADSVGYVDAFGFL